MKTMLSYDECSRSCGALGLYNIPVDCDTREGERGRGGEKKGRKRGQEGEEGKAFICENH